MTIQLPPRIIAEFIDYETMLSALRIRLSELNIVGTTLDEHMCLPDGYTSKVLGPKPARGITKFTMGSFLGGLGVKCLLIEDPVTAPRLTMDTKVKPRNPNLVRDAVKVVFTRREMKKIASKGGKAWAASLTPEQLSKIGRRRARIRWRKVSRQRRLQQQEGKRE